MTPSSESAPENEPSKCFKDLINERKVGDGQYDTNSNDLVVEFYAPILGAAKKYDGSTGSFSVAGIKALAMPLVPFIRNALSYDSSRPVMRIVASHDISEIDYDQMNKGYDARQKISEEELVSILKGLERSSDQELLRAVRNIGTMVQLGLLDIKIAIPTNKLGGLYHRKAGIFVDFRGDIITFEGSQNFTKGGDGSETNLEGLVAFCSNETTVMKFKHGHVTFFDQLWDDKLQNVRVRPLSQYPKELLAGFGVPIETILRELEPPESVLPPPRECQREAVGAWMGNDRRGILDMCTGSGKSRVALMALDTIKEAPLTVIVTGNLIDLVDQWAEKEIIPTYGIHGAKVLKISSLHGSREDLHGRLSGLIQDYLQGYYASPVKRVFVLATIQSASQEWFRSLISRVNPSRLAIVIDEVHHAGALGPTGDVLKIDARYRIGLSATWRRYDDDENGKLEDYFRGKESVVPFSYSLSRGITDEILSPYHYFVHPINLDPNDLVELRQRLEEYDKQLKKIDPSLGLSREDEAMALASKSKLPKLHEFRDSWKNTLGRAIAKTDVALEVVEAEYQDLKKCIIYCADKQQLDRTAELMVGRHWPLEPYDSHVGNEIRKRIRNKFAEPYNGQPLFVGAIKCLDEGIDLPALDSAILVASSRTEREWIQRRGRILRRHPGKKSSIIHDFIMLPYSSAAEAFPLTKYELAYVNSELDRLEAFGVDALNKEDVLEKLRTLRRLFSNA